MDSLLNTIRKIKRKSKVFTKCVIKITAIKWLLSLLLPNTMMAYAQTDTTIFSVKNFITQVKNYHPIAKQASIMVRLAESEIMYARGSFDPSVDISSSRKTLDGKNYYYYTNPEIKIPLPVGDIRMGVENNGGSFLSSESTTGKSSYLGLEMPLSRGLLIDKRRATLQQAIIYKSQREQDQIALLNSLIYDAYTCYWQWAGNYELLRIYTDFLRLAENRLRLIRIAYQQGDRSVMDTVEAYTQMQQYQLTYSQALINFNNAKLELSNYLWKENDLPVELPDTFIPDSINYQMLAEPINEEALIAQSVISNPQLKSYQLKLKNYAIDKKLKAQSLLPYISLKANILNKGYEVFNNVLPENAVQNYKWGFSFKMPLFLREERAGYIKVKLAIKDTELGFAVKQREINTKITGYLLTCKQLAAQLFTTRDMCQLYGTLLRNEELKLTQGESSVFMVNSREIKLAELLQKNVELCIKYQKAKYAAEYTAGTIQ